MPSLFSNLLYMLTCTSYVKSSPSSSRKQSHAAALSILLSPGLLIIDHIHFQYNGFLYGILILSIVLARKQSGLLASGIVFAALLCLKHIYLYLAPAYFVYLLRAYCLGPRSVFDVKLGNCIKLGVSLGVVFGIAFGPFYDQMPQVLSRLFPFSRGLCHAYWAPNVWAMYSWTDRVLIYGKQYHGTTENDTGLIRLCSGALPQATCRQSSSQQCHPRPCRRHLFRRLAQYLASHDVRPNFSSTDRESYLHHEPPLRH